MNKTTTATWSTNTPPPANVNKMEETIEEEEEEYFETETGKDALIILLDIRKKMQEQFSKDQKKNWFQNCIEFIVKIMKSKIIANDNSLTSLIFIGSVAYI